MNEIKCPKCGETFQVDESSFKDIAQQIRDSEFEKALQERLDLAEENLKNALELAEAKAEKVRQEDISSKESEIEKLKGQIANADMARQIAVQEAKSTLEKERDSLKSALEKSLLQKELEEKSIKERYETQLKDRDDAIERLRDLKNRLGSKMVGETLEEHCSIEFDRIRATAFPNAEFGKDNDAKTGSKGDFIFRDFDESGTEIISIMFEMKNESDTTKTKQKNEKFFAELDKDRNEKGCEYAVLVTQLEKDNELYNTGIVDVSHRYPKMYVIRPQFFIQIISVLRNASLNALQYKSELAIVRAQNIDVSNFESKLEKFKSDFGRNYDLASRHFHSAISEIDKTIAGLEKVKTSLLKSESQLGTANKKAQDVSIKSLTRGNPTMKAKFEETQN